MRLALILSPSEMKTLRFTEVTSLPGVITQSGNLNPKCHISMPTFSLLYMPSPTEWQDFPEEKKKNQECHEMRRENDHIQQPSRLDSVSGRDGSGRLNRSCGPSATTPLGKPPLSPSLGRKSRNGKGPCQPRMRQGTWSPAAGRAGGPAVSPPRRVTSLLPAPPSAAAFSLWPWTQGGALSRAPRCSPRPGSGEGPTVPLGGRKRKLRGRSWAGTVN